MLVALHDRLVARLTPPLWDGVEIAENIDVLTDRAGQVAHGTAIIMPVGERAQPPVVFTGAVRQLVQEQYAIGIVIRIYDHRMGADRALAFAEFKHTLEQALCGWVPPDSPSDCILIGGEASPVAKGVSIYVQSWAIPRFLTGVFS